MHASNADPPRSVAAIYRQHFGFVWAALRSLGVPEAGIEDAVQDVFIVVHRRLDTFESRSGIRGWLFGIARRVAYRARRGRARTERRRRAVASVAPTAVDGEAAIAERLLGARLLRALDELDEDKRTALILHVMHDLTGPEIAELLGVRVDTAYSRIKAARQRLRLALGPADELVFRDALHRVTRAPTGSRRRVWGSLLLRLGRGASPVSAGLSFAYVAAAGIAVLAAVGIGGLVAPPEPTSARAAPISETAVDFEPTGPERARIGPMVAPPVLARVPSLPSAGARSRPPPRPVGPDGLGEEVALLDRVRTALEVDDISTARRALDLHATRYPSGQLAVEREGYRALADCQAGELATGELRARRFVEAHPTSGLAALVRDRCGLDPSGDSA